TSCVDDKDGFDVWDCEVLSLEAELPVGKFVTWVISTVPCLPDCLKQYFHARLQIAVAEGDESASSDSPSVEEISSTTACDYILTQGRAWAISITQRSTINEEISRAFISSGAGIDENLIYRFVSLILSHIHCAVLVY
ncbi:TLD domain-containing protein KIAA1609-like protein, partial [Trifolium medium]|nr:TLD domain-containing protein KIAA1609-like protein [Trifolium medium]